MGIVVEVANPRKDSLDNEISILRESINKDLQQNSNDLETKECSPEKNSNLDISANKSQCTLDNDTFNQKENINLERVDFKSKNATEQKPQKKSMISLKERMK